MADQTAEPRTSALRKAKLYVVIKDGIARVFRGNRELGHAGVSDHFVSVRYLEDAHVVVVSWIDSSGPDWCADHIGTAFVSVPTSWE